MRQLLLRRCWPANSYLLFLAIIEEGPNQEHQIIPQWNTWEFWEKDSLIATNDGCCLFIRGTYTMLMWIKWLFLELLGCQRGGGRNIWHYVNLHCQCYQTYTFLQSLAFPHHAKVDDELSFLFWKCYWSDVCVNLSVNGTLLVCCFWHQEHLTKLKEDYLARLYLASLMWRLDPLLQLP